MSTLFRRVSPVAGMVFAMAASPVHASGNDIVLHPSVTQTEFNNLIDEFGALVSYKSVTPNLALGMTGFDLGVSVSSVDINSRNWDQAVRDGSAPSHLSMSRISARKGFPYGIDIGASYSHALNSDFSVVGGEVRKALLPDSVLVPAVSVSGHYSVLSGVDDLDVAAYGIDLGVSKGISLFTPYAGIGQVWFEGSENHDTLTLADRSSSHVRSYLGLRVAVLPFMNVTAQADFSEINTYSLRLNLGF